VIRALVGLAYPAYLAVAGWTARARARARDEAGRRRAVGVFVAFTLAAAVVPGLVQRSAWPFTAWTVFQLVLPPVVGGIRIVGVDAAGGEHLVDARAWEPLSAVELGAFLQHRLPGLGPADRAEVGRYLLDRANEGRARAAAGRRIGRFDRYLGPLAAPLHIVPRRHWDRPEAVPPGPFVRLRVYWERWDVEARRRDPGRFERDVLLEHPAS
jgi:hypothetical protein